MAMRPVKVVVIMSLDGGVGKTTLSAVLSVAKGYTLIVDMDWEKADLSQLFRAPKKPGWLAPFINGDKPYVHRVSPWLYVIPGYEAYEIYQREGEDVVKDFAEVMLEWAEEGPKFVSKLRIPVDTVIIDSTAALPLQTLAKLQKMGAYNIFVADRRLISRISDVKSEQYRQYMTYSAMAVVNMVEKNEVKIAKKVVPVAIKRVKMSSEYYGEVVARDVLRDPENRKSVEGIVMRLKTS
ncbi:ATPases involved in chromosome partitioning [Pyrobaculum oguniense TE7]|uniref:ATPases involved in chromosome partitioning n=1 Tax=Pyrobaculum oguniense (strain DSM 13380 / JCM 10595 / TE7) TaxID=698757 RepID=H6Q7W9_PYROT|nr:ATPases involved in chromosome partitioning [Pyrobaculum oguniense TE7]